MIAAAGGEEKLLTKFRLEERLKLGDDAAELFQSLEGRRPRISVIDAPNLWWLKKGGEWEERGNEPAKWLAYGWTLSILKDEKAELEILPDPGDGASPSRMIGLRVSNVVEPEMDLYFDSETMLLVRIDWDDEICRFSDPKESDGFLLPTRCVGYRRGSNQVWYVSLIDKVERLEEIPDDVDSRK